VSVDVFMKREPEKFALKDIFGRRDLAAKSFCKAIYPNSRANRQVCTLYKYSKLVMESGITPEDCIIDWSTYPINSPKLRRCSILVSKM